MATTASPLSHSSLVPDQSDPQQASIPFSSRLYFLLPYMIPQLILQSIHFGGLWYAAPVLLIFGAIPILDTLVGGDPFNPPESLYKALSQDAFYRYVLYAYVPVQLAVLIYAAYIAGQTPLTPLELVGLTLSVGIMNGALGITFAHELGHKTTRLEQNLARILLWMVCYMHFHIEHNQGHHTNVSTFRDPATSRFNESFYRFYPRTVLGSIKSAWQLECRRLDRSHKPRFSHHNLMLWYAVLPLALAAFLGGLFGPLAVVFFFGQALAAFSLLELVNYVEHYGLERKELAPGKYERVNPLHSWNSNHRVTNGFLIMLQRHSDHHANPMRRYQTLRHFEESPQLPTGYAGMVVLALFPPLWFRVMNPRVLEFRARQNQVQEAPGQ